MIILLSPAKTLDLESAYSESGTEPRFAPDAKRIARAAARLEPARLGRIMHISDKLAALNSERFRRFAEAEERPAIRMFAGDVYRGFDAASADPDTLEFAQGHLRIISGLYGLLRPLDRIRPYRLEMGTRWSPKGDRLIEHWGAKIGRAVKADLAADGSNTLLNLASAEYFEAVGPHLSSRVRVIAPDFRVRTARGLSFHSFTAKVARGAMARFVCEERIDDPRALRDFDHDGWRFDPDGTSEEIPRFIRN